VLNLPNGWLWALFQLAAGGSIIALREQARRSVVEAIARGLAIEAAAADTRLALALAAAERDAKARFLASASHDLKQPLAAARIWASVGLDAPPGPARANALAKADAAFGAATRLVDSMLDHLRLEAGAERARIEAVPVGLVLLAAAEAHEPAAAAAGLRIRARDGTLAVAADPALLARAIDNLVDNAIRHSGARRLLLAARREGGGVAIWVIDDGRGVAVDERDRLFDDYVQGALAGPGGFGIGLASVQRLLVLMAGAVTIDPRWTGGAAFRLWLPAATPARVAIAA
jgi:signal transduction histidine kinase